MKIVNALLSYQGKEYLVHGYDNWDEWEDEFIEHCWTEGNFACDCNLSKFIGDEVDDNFLEMECGEEIKLLSLKIDGKESL